MGRNMPGGVSMAAVAVGGMLSAVDVTILPGPGQIPDLPEVAVIARLFPREKGMEGMVEIVVPLGVQAVSP
jgi:hypothetical protein